MSAGGPEPRSTTLPNGVRVVTEAMPTARSVTTGVWVRVGARDEAPADAGVSHFLEHLFFKGTEERSAREIAELIDGVGGDMNAYTSTETTSFYTRLPARHWRIGVELLGEILAAPALRPREVDAERAVILEELHAALDSPEDVAHQRSNEALFPEHPLGREVLGSVETVRSMTPAGIRSFFETHYRPANLVVTAAGALDHDAVVEAVERHLGSVTGGERPRRRPPEARPEPLVVVPRECEQVHVLASWRSLDQGDDDRYALAVANQLLGGGTSSRLFQAVREERGLAYSVYSHVSTHSDTGGWTLYAATSPGRVDELIDVLDGEVASLLESGPTDAEVDRAIGSIEGATELSLEDSGSRMGRLGRMLMARDDLEPLDDQLARLRAVTAADVARVCRRVLGGDRSLVVLGPVRSDRLERRLAR